MLARAVLAVAAFTVLLPIPDPVRAQGAVPATRPEPVVRSYGPVSLEASIGIMQGEANEYVYRPDGSTVSQLVWAFDDNVVFNGGIAVRPLDWLTVGLRGRIKLSGGSTMDDYDWYRPSEPEYANCPAGFCHSHHPDTSLVSYLSVDGYLAATFYSNSFIAFKALAGYKRDTQSWKAFDGPANYYNYVPGRLAISYKQVWEAPYLGLQFDSAWRRWTFDARVIGSWWVQGQDRDNHHMRTLLFTESFGQSDMIGANARLGYRLNEHWKLTGEYDLQQWGLAKGPTTILNYSTDTTTYIGGKPAGAQSISQTVSVGAVLEY